MKLTQRELHLLQVALKYAQINTDDINDMFEAVDEVTLERVEGKLDLAGEQIDAVAESEFEALMERAFDNYPDDDV